MQKWRKKPVAETTTRKRTETDRIHLSTVVIFLFSVTNVFAQNKRTRWINRIFSSHRQSYTALFLQIQWKIEARRDVQNPGLVA